MEKKLIYPEHPELEQGNYEAQTEAQIAESKRLAELQERRAKRDRDMAILGDIANMVSKGAAMHGGAWKVNKDEPMAAKGNEKLRALQESNSKQLAEYAKMRLAAKDADRKERNAAAVAKYNADVNAYKSAVEAERYAKEEDRRAKVADSEIEKNKAYRAYYENGGSGNKSAGKAKNIRYLGDWEFDFDSAAEVDEAYARMVQADSGKAVQEYDTVAMTEKPVANPSTAQKRDALVRGGITKEKPQNGVVDNTPPSRRNNNSNTPPSRRQ